MPMHYTDDNEHALFFKQYTVRIIPFAAILTANTMLPLSPLAVTGDTFCYMHYIDGKSHKSELKTDRNYSTNHTQSKSHH